MNLIESKKADGQVCLVGQVGRLACVFGFFSVALAINLFELVYLAWHVCFSSPLVILATYPFIGMQGTAEVGMAASNLSFVSIALWFLGILAVPQILAGFNHYALASLAGKNKALFVKCLAFTSIFWAVGAFVMATFLLKLVGAQEFMHLVPLPLSIFLGCLSQFWFASRVIKSTQNNLTATVSNYSKISAESNNKIENIANATTSSEMENLAAEVDVASQNRMQILEQE